MTSCSVEIGGFCDSSYLVDFHCFLEWVFELKAALVVFKDIEKPYTVARGSRLRKGTPAIGCFRSPFRPLFFLTLQLSSVSGTLARSKLMPDLE